MNPTQQYKGNQKSGFKRKRNESGNDEVGASKIRKKMRDMQRLLKNKERLPAQAITESKRKLRALQYELGERLIDEKERKMASKYHKVKHFERKKVERKIKQKKKSLEEEKEEDKKKKIQADLDELKIKELYIREYPKTVPYVSLYPKENENDEVSVTRKQRILSEIKSALANGDKNLHEFKKSYREKYKQKLIKQGDIVIEPLAEDEEQPKEEEKNRIDEDEDDFFEK
ncbi:hypothetical protein G6F37_008945 [Rhizopus arrhizus]|nr:hypothetical protein G6F38_008972 [Rhizopus arrhizus]KAG1154992.1 hypothetical protein G6F37_008945 [Rhizopus arrhizus]